MLSVRLWPKVSKGILYVAVTEAVELLYFSGICPGFQHLAERHLESLSHFKERQGEELARVEGYYRIGYMLKKEFTIRHVQ